MYVYVYVYMYVCIFILNMTRRASRSRAARSCSRTFRHPVVELRANRKSISHRCHLFEVAFVWELTEETIHLPLGCLQRPLGRGFSGFVFDGRFAFAWRSYPTRWWLSLDQNVSCTREQERDIGADDAALHAREHQGHALCEISLHAAGARYQMCQMSAMSGLSMADI